MATRTNNPYAGRLPENRRPVASGSARRVESGKDDAREEARKRLSAKIREKFASKKDEGAFDSDGTFNPQRYDHASSRRASASRTDRRMFDKKGELNAVSNRDALTQVSHLLNTETKRNADRLHFYNPDEPKISKEAKNRILAAALTDPTGAGFHIVGEELALPIKVILDYEGFSRKIYKVKELAQAELFRIPVDIRSTAWYVGQDGQAIESRIKTKWIIPPEFKIASFPTVDIQDIYHMNFDVLERAQDTARQEIELKEDKAGIALIDEASQVDNDVTLYASLGIGAFEDVRYQVERHRLIVERFLINRQEVSDIVKTMATAVDMVTERELILAGYIGRILNADIITTAGTGVEEVIPRGVIYATTGPEYLGVMGIRVGLFSEPYNKYANQETVKGWAFLEIVGFGLPNSRACAKGMK